MVAGLRGGPRGAGVDDMCDVIMTWVMACGRGGIGMVVSGFPAPPLLMSGIGRGGSEQPRRLTRVQGTERETTFPRC